MKKEVFKVYITSQPHRVVILKMLDNQIHYPKKVRHHPYHRVYDMYLLLSKCGLNIPDNIFQKVNSLSLTSAKLFRMEQIGRWK